jgi:signal transduction histidine kinase
VLRRDEQLGVDELPDLFQHFSRTVNLNVTYSITGMSRPLGSELGLALYRVAGEALTNVARHAQGAITRVELAFESASVRLEVTNSGGTPSVHAGEGSGWGLAGVRERIERLGGELTAGPSGSGWSVVVSAPT